MRNITKHLDLILYKSLADLRSEVRRYYISYLWWILEPILEMLVFYLVFGILLRRGIPDYVPFLLIGFTAWKWFSTTIRHAATSIINNRNLIHQVNLPKTVFPTVIVLTDTFKFSIVFAILVVFCLLYGFRLDTAYLAFPLLLLTQLLLISALAFFFAAVTPFFPDLDIFLENFLRLWFFLSGIFYDGKSLPPEYQLWFYLNPMANIVEGYRDILMHHQVPSLSTLFVISASSIVCIFFGKGIINHFDKVYPRITTQ